MLLYIYVVPHLKAKPLYIMSLKIKPLLLKMDPGALGDWSKNRPPFRLKIAGSSSKTRLTE